MKVGVEGFPRRACLRVAILAPIGGARFKIKRRRPRAQRSRSRSSSDPGAGGTEADVRAQGDLVKVLLDDVEADRGRDQPGRAAMRSQLATLQVRLGEKKDGKEPVHEGREGRGGGAGQEGRGRARRRYSRCASPAAARTSLRFADEDGGALLYLLARVSETDFAPTAAQREVHQILHEEAAKSRQALDDVFAADLVKLNALLAEKQLAGVVANFPTRRLVAWSSGVRRSGIDEPPVARAARPPATAGRGRGSAGSGPSNRLSWESREVVPDDEVAAAAGDRRSVREAAVGVIRERFEGEAAGHGRAVDEEGPVAQGHFLAREADDAHSSRARPPPRQGTPRPPSGAAAGTGRRSSPVTTTSPLRTLVPRSVGPMEPEVTVP